MKYQDMFPISSIDISRVNEAVHELPLEIPNNITRNLKIDKKYETKWRSVTMNNLTPPICDAIIYIHLMDELKGLDFLENRYCTEYHKIIKIFKRANLILAIVGLLCSMTIIGAAFLLYQNNENLIALVPLLISLMLIGIAFFITKRPLVYEDKTIYQPLCQARFVGELIKRNMDVYQMIITIPGNDKKVESLRQYILERYNHI